MDSNVRGYFLLCIEPIQLAIGTRSIAFYVNDRFPYFRSHTILRGLYYRWYTQVRRTYSSMLHQEGIIGNRPVSPVPFVCCANYPCIGTISDLSPQFVDELVARVFSEVVGHTGF